MAHDVFISYAPRDKVLADAVCGVLETRHIRCWIAPRDITPGTSYAQAIIDALSACRVVIVLLSSESIASQNVASELERALHGGKTILPVRIEDVYPTGSLEYYLAGKHWLDVLTPPIEVHLEKVAEAVGQLLNLGAVLQGPIPVAESAPTPKLSGFQARNMFNEAKAFNEAGQYAQAVPIYRQVLPVLEELDNKSGAASCAAGLAWCLMPNHNPAGTWAEALAIYRKALALYELCGDEPNQVVMHGNLGYILRPDNNPAGNWQEAVEAFRRKAVVAGKVGNKAEEASALADAGWCAMPDRNPQGKWQEAETLFCQAARLYEEVNDALNQGIALHNQAFCKIQGEEAKLTDETRQLFQRAAELKRGVGNVKSAEASEYFVRYRTSAADQVFTQARAAFKANQWAEAALLHAQAAEIFASEGNLSRQAFCLHEQAWCLAPERNPAGSWATCIALLRKAAELHAGTGEDSEQAQNLVNLSTALKQTGDWAEARKVLQQAVELKRKAGDTKGEVYSLEMLGFAYWEDKTLEGNCEKAIGPLKAALALCVAAVDQQFSEKAVILELVGDCYDPQSNPVGDWLQAAAYYREAGEAYRAEGDLKKVGVCLHKGAFCLMRGDGKNMTEETWEMFRMAAQYRRQAGDMEGAKSSESWLH